MSTTESEQYTRTPTPCEAEPDLWFSKTKKKQEQAKAGCRRCTRMLECLNQALETEEMLGHQLTGIHGGLNPSERLKTKMRKIA